MTPFETIEIDEMVAACNGGGGPLGHPRVFLNLAPTGRIECPYCSRMFVNRHVNSHSIPEGAKPGSGVVMPSPQGGEETAADQPAPRQSPVQARA